MLQHVAVQHRATTSSMAFLNGQVRLLSYARRPKHSLRKRRSRPLSPHSARGARTMINTNFI